MVSAIRPDLVIESIIQEEYSMFVYIAIVILLLVIILKLTRKSKFSLFKLFKVINIVYISGLITYIVLFNLDIPQIFMTNVFRFIILLTPLILIDLLYIVISSCFNYFKKKKFEKKNLYIFLILLIILILLLLFTHNLWKQGHYHDFIYYIDEIQQIDDISPWMKDIE